MLAGCGFMHLVEPLVIIQQKGDIMIWDKYAEKVNAIHKEQFNAKTFVEAQIKDFVGTQDQINEEKTRLVAEAEGRELAIRTAYYAEYNAIVEEYTNALFSDYTVPKEVLDKAYSTAHDRGHSADYSEVECIFNDLVGTFIEIYNLGLKNRD